MIAVEPPLIGCMLEAALKGAHIALKRRQEGALKIGEKNEEGQISRVTNGDSQSEQIIRHELEARYPNIGFIMEETARDLGKRYQGRHFVVDPIDGTRGYSRQDVAPWAISIALEDKGRTVAAVVYEAALNEYGVDAQGEDLPFDPYYPQGHLFWAAGELKHACRIDPPAGGFRITGNAGPGAYDEYEEGGLWRLKRVPSLEADYRSGDACLLDASRPILPDAPLQLDSFSHIPDASVEAALEVLCARMRPPRAVERCLSAVAGGVRAADGRACGFVNGNGWPWDHSAIRLILAKAGIAMAEYDVPGQAGHSLLIAARDTVLFDELTQALQYKGVLGAPMPH